MGVWARTLGLFAVAVVLGCQPRGEGPVTVASSVAGLEAREGFFTVYPDEDGGRVLAALPAPDPETRVSLRAIHIAYLRTGLGSNPVGLDRGLSGEPAVVRFEVRGPRVFLVAENTRFTASAANPAERRAAEESFARSILWSTDVIAADETRVLIDVSSLLTSDAMGVARRLADRGQGAFARVADRSAPDPEASLAFPDNVELEGVVTFAGDAPGPEVQATAAVANAITLTMHHSFVRLPAEGFQRRPFDPRMGVIGYPVADYAAGLDAPIERLSTLRFRLEKTDPTAERSTVVKPIVFYVDRGAPEPVRDALVEGASWWAAAFEAAGFVDAYRVELLPEDAHPLDARYNVIQWVHRQTRGWSYGSPIYDPRTGEIIKAVITLGSLRVRQDRRIFEGLLDAQRTGSGAPDDPIVLSLARLRQLSAHEVGHGLGFPHNFAASANDRASVMDYPAPKVSVSADGALDVSEAYGVGVGAWDIATTRYLYSVFPGEADEAAALEAIIADAEADGLLFVADGDARPLGAAHPSGSLWDNGADPLDALEEALSVRQIALADFGLANLPDGAAASDLREVITPIHLWHRYAVDAAAKELGGHRFAYAVADAGSDVTPVPAERQWRALSVLLRAASAAEVTLPPDLGPRLTPAHRSWFASPSRELLVGRMGAVFDAPAAAATAAGLVFDAVLAPARASRLAAGPAGAPTLDETLGALSDQVLRELDAEDADQRAAARAIAERYALGLVALARSDAASPVATSVAEQHLVELASALETGYGASRRALGRKLRRFAERREEGAPASSPPAPPPGSPIGGGLQHLETGWHDG